MKKSAAIVIACILIFMGLALLSAGCGSKAVQYDPFQVPREKFYGGLKTIALAPIWAPKELEVSDSVKAKFEFLLAAELRGAGFTVVPSEELGTLRSTLTDSVGGTYDSKTGKPDTAKAKTVWKQMHRQLRAKFNVNAILSPEIQVVAASFGGDRAKWDGTSEGVGKKKFWKALLGTTHSGRVPALSFVVFLKDSDYTSLYVNAGGIQALDKVGPAGGFVPVPQEELFAKEERNVKAVRLALDPLLGRKKEK